MYLNAVFQAFYSMYINLRFNTSSQWKPLWVWFVYSDGTITKIYSYLYGSTYFEGRYKGISNWNKIFCTSNSTSLWQSCVGAFDTCAEICGLSSRRFAKFSDSRSKGCFYVIWAKIALLALYLLLPITLNFVLTGTRCQANIKQR